MCVKCMQIVQSYVLLRALTGEVNKNLDFFFKVDMLNYW